MENMDVGPVNSSDFVDVIRVEITKVNCTPFHKLPFLATGAKEFTDQEICDLWTETLGHDTELLSVIDQYRSALGNNKCYTFLCSLNSF